MTYDYQCAKCGVITVEKTMNEAGITNCPICNEFVKRIYAPVASIAKCEAFCGKVNNK